MVVSHADLSIKSHGKFRSPRTHGRLYDKCILPEWPVHRSLPSQGIQSAVDRLNTTLEGKILQTLRTKRTSRHHPNESVLQMCEPWSSNSTLPESEKRQSIAETSDGARFNVPRELNECPVVGLDLAGAGVSSKIAFEKRMVETEETSAARATPNANQSIERRQKGVSPSGPAVTPLSRGDTFCHKLTRLRDTWVIQTDVITLHASWDWHSIEPAFGASATQNACWIQVKWLTQTESITVEGGSALSQKALSVKGARYC